MGPAVQPNNNAYASIPTFSETPTVFTAAGFFFVTSFANGGTPVNDTQGSGAYVTVTTNNHVNLRTWGQNTYLTAASYLTTNTLYFYAVSATSGSQNGVVVNLATGQTVNGTNNVTLTPIASTSWTIGSNYGGIGVGVWFGPQMMGRKFLSLQQLMAWAADPWSFWYPSTIYDLTTQAPATTITGALSVTEAGDALSASGMLTVSGALTVTEAADVLSSTGMLSVSGALTATEANDTLTAAGTSLNYGTLTVTESNDTLAASGMLSVSGVLTVTEANDVLTAGGTVGVLAGTLTVTEANDTLSATGQLLVTGTLTVTEASDTLSASGMLLVTGTLTVTEAADTLSAGGLILPVVTGILTVTEASDALVAAGTIALVATGTLTVTEAPDTLTSQAFIYTTPPTTATQAFFNPGSEWQFWDRLTDRNSVQ